MATRKYSSEDIQTFVGLEKVRKFPTMYIGSTDADGLFLILRELLDNGVDEFTAGRASSIQAYIPVKGSKDNTYYVLDDGTGVPQGIKKIPVEVSGKTVISKMETMQAVFGELHTSGKHSEAYGASMGVHGVGAKGTNALSLTFDVYTYYKKQWYHIGFEKGKLTQAVRKVKRPAKNPFGKVTKGTLIVYKPDPSIFSAKNFGIGLAYEWSEISTYLNPKLKVSITHNKETKTFYSERGPLDYLDNRLATLKAKPINDAIFQHTSALVDIVVSFTDYEGNDLKGFTNGLFNGEGGTHINSVQSAMYRAVKEHAKKKQEFTAHEFRDGLVGLVNAKLSGAKFSSQAKVRLADERMSGDFEEEVYELAVTFFKANKKLAETICERCTKLKELKSKFKASRKVLQELNKVKRLGLPAKYSPAHPSTKPKDRELILVEGDSASGGLKNARFKHQAILPLKGKIANALKSEKVLESEEVINILAAIGFEPNSKDPYGRMNVGKIICLADPDPDGPFVAGTKVNVVKDGQEQTLPIEELVSLNFKVQTVVSSKGEVGLRDATCNLVGYTTDLVELRVGKSKYITDENHNWPVINFKPYDVSEGTVVQRGILHYKKAKDLRVGDRILDIKGSKDKHTGHTYSVVNKLRKTQVKEPVPVYCLTVPSTGNFVLPSGVVSSNCHINSLLLTLIYKYMPDLIDKGMVYVADAPEFYCEHKGKLYVGDTLSEVRSALEKVKVKNPVINHIKGWGEVDEEELLHFALNEKTRKLIKIELGSNSDNFEKLMNDDVEYRRNFLGIGDD